MPLEARVTRKSKVSLKVDNSTKVLSAFETGAAGALKPNNGRQVCGETQSGLGNEAPIGIKTAPGCHNRLKIPGKKYGNISEDKQRRPTAHMMLENTFSDTRKRAKRSVGTTYTENVDRSISGEAQSRDRFVETVQGVSNPRAEYRRTGEETRGSNPRQSEPHLDTSTFALSGDSAHNQAMVHWSGHNSSVSSVLQKHFIISYMFSRTCYFRTHWFQFFCVKCKFWTFFNRFTWICHIFTHSCFSAHEENSFMQTNYLSLT